MQERGHLGPVVNYFKIPLEPLINLLDLLLLQLLVVSHGHLVEHLSEAREQDVLGLVPRTLLIHVVLQTLLKFQRCGVVLIELIDEDLRHLLGRGDKARFPVGTAETCWHGLAKDVGHNLDLILFYIAITANLIIENSQLNTKT